MKLLSMTATFGKLQNATLELKEGFNLIHAPNEWGKTTWCAFLVNMLYGIDTRERTTATVMADKDRYAPWSGAPMAGTLRILWKGRDLTLERTSKGRVPLGNFRAYETETGIEVPELTASNCGQTLLGVERSVFLRSGFVRLADLPVTQDEALRRRLNALVTTGDESGTDDKLEQSLRELKNKCRYNQTGLIPQAEAEAEQLGRQLSHLRTLNDEQARCIRSRQELEDTLAQLDNHMVALRHQAFSESALRTAQAEQAIAQARDEVAQLELSCQSLPEEEAAKAQLQTTRTLMERKSRLELERSLVPAAPAAPVLTGPTDPEAAARDVQSLQAICSRANAAKNKGILLGCCLAAVALVLLFLSIPKYFAAIPAVAALAVFLLLFSHSKKQLSQSEALKNRYPGLAPQQWEATAQANVRALEQHEKAVAAYEAAQQDLSNRQNALEQAIAALTPSGDLQTLCTKLQQGLEAGKALTQTQKELERLLAHKQDLEALSQPAPAPAFPDTLTLSQAETRQTIALTQAKLQKLQMDLGKVQGQMQTLGTEEVLRARLDSANRRLARLQDYNGALELALDAMYKAKTSLQRRFAPKLVKRTEALFSRLTDGRYSKVSMAEDLSLRTAAQGETTLEPVRVRSEGTVDQLYLALRLAVSLELTPDAPLILDDALVRFDDQRHAKALELLQELTDTKQVIVFSCQSRTAQ